MAQNAARGALSLAVGLGLGVFAGRIGYTGALLTRIMITGRRQPLWRLPAELGMRAENVEFTAIDGVQLRGWFIRRADDDGRPAPAIVFVHGWPWNRLGNRAGELPIPDQTVDLLEPAHTLHRAGFHVLLFDLRNHGLSGTKLPVTFGVHEARDLIAAVSTLRERPEVDGDRIGAIGYSMGANTLLYGLPYCQPVRAAVAVQPVRIGTFAQNFAATTLGPAGPALLKMAAPLHQAFGSPPLDQIDPTESARRLDETEVLYIQGSGDPWGSMEDILAMVAATPRTRPLVVAPSTDRYGGYQYVNHHPSEITGFFREALG